MTSGRRDGLQPAPAAAPPIGRLAWRVFAPFDATINIAINGGIAWWLYGGRDGISLAGPYGLPMMALPMTLILATLTTLFGWFNAVRERRAGRASPPLATDARWAARAWLDAILTGAVAWLLAGTVGLAVRSLAPDASLGPTGAILSITAYAGLLAFLLHGRAVSRGGRFQARG